MCYLCLSFIGDAEKRNIDSTCVSNRIFSCAINPVVTVSMVRQVKAIGERNEPRHAFKEIICMSH